MKQCGVNIIVLVQWKKYNPFASLALKIVATRGYVASCYELLK
jgi:hypothetical protein